MTDTITNILFILYAGALLLISIVFLISLIYHAKKYGFKLFDFKNDKKLTFKNEIMFIDHMSEKLVSKVGTTRVVKKLFIVFMYN